MLFDTLLLDSSLPEFERNLIYLASFFAFVSLGCLVARKYSANFFPGMLSLIQERKFVTLCLGISLLIGAALRFYSLDFGLPRPYHPDELQKARFLTKMMARGEIDPHFNLQPPLLLYLGWLLSPIVKLLGYFPTDPVARNLLAGRAVNAICGTLSIYLVYLCGKKFSKSNLVGAISAAIIAVCPIHVTNSRYMKEDVLFITFALLCVIAVFAAVDTKKVAYLYLGGFLAGLSLGSKYTGLVSFTIVLGAPWLLEERFKWKPNIPFLKHSLLAMLMIPVGVALAMPYILQDGDTAYMMFTGFQAESRHAMRGHLGLVISPWSQLWMYHFSRSVIPGIGFIATYCGLLGIGAALWRWNSRGLFCVALFAVFFLPAEWANSKPPPQPDRYILAAIPFLAILAADFIVSVRHLLQERPTLLRPVFLVAILAILPAVQTLAYATEVRHDTRRKMSNWMEANLRPGSRIALSGGSVYLPYISSQFKGKAARKIFGKDKSQMVKQLKDSDYDYLLTSSFGGDRFEVENPGKHSRIREGLRLIEQNFEVIHQSQPKFGSYGFHNPTVTLYALKKADDPE